MFDCMDSELTPLQAFMVLNALPHVGPITMNRLLSDLEGDPRAIFRADAERLERVKGVGKAISQTIMHWPEFFDVAREEERMAAHAGDFIVASAEGYPPLLREIHDPPIGLYRKGPFSFDRPCVAIVGSRRTTLYGQSVARRLAADLAKLGFCVVSGLARGIDTAAHEGALSVGGLTAAILGNGIDLVYPPENLALYRQIGERGALLSEFPYARRADRQSFAMRNRIVAGMSTALIVVESDLGGGSMITAKFAADQGRLVFAVPGRIDQPTSAGCHQLIRDGATLLTGIEDVLSELSYLDGLRPAPIPANAARGMPALEFSLADLSEDERNVLRCLADGSMLAIDQLAGLANVAPATLAAVLMRLELKRRVVKRADGRFEAVGLG